MITAQIGAVTNDFTVKAVKTGMPFSQEIIHAVANALRASKIPLVVDPVMIAKEEVLTEMRIHTNRDIFEATEHILALGAEAVVIKGGHRKGAQYAEELFMSRNGKKFSVHTPWIHTKDTHGTGCTYSAAVMVQRITGHMVVEPKTKNY